MAIRYSGDVEIRIQYLGDNHYRAMVRVPGKHIVMNITRRFLLREPNSPDAYDAVANTAILAILEKTSEPLPIETDERGNIVVRRMFQAPCPLEEGV